MKMIRTWVNKICLCLEKKYYWGVCYIEGFINSTLFYVLHDDNGNISNNLDNL